MIASKLIFSSNFTLTLNLALKSPMKGGVKSALIGKSRSNYLEYKKVSELARTENAVKMAFKFKFGAFFKNLYIERYQ